MKINALINDILSKCVKDKTITSKGIIDELITPRKIGVDKND